MSAENRDCVLLTQDKVRRVYTLPQRGFHFTSSIAMGKDLVKLIGLGIVLASEAISLARKNSRKYPSHYGNFPHVISTRASNHRNGLGEVQPHQTVGPPLGPQWKVVKMLARKLFSDFEAITVQAKYCRA